MPLTIKVQGQDIKVLEEFVYLGSIIHSSTGSTCDISRWSAITRAAMQSLENQIWRLAISTKLKLYNTCILPIFLYGSDCWAISKTDTHCYNPVAPAYPIWAYYAHGRQSRCQEDPVSLPFGRLEKTARLSPHHVAQHRPTGSETTPPYAPRSSWFGSELPSVENDVDIWWYAIVSCTPETTMTTTPLTAFCKIADMCRFPSRT